MKDLVNKLKELQKGLSNNADRARLDSLIIEAEADEPKEPVSRPPSPTVAASVIPSKPEVAPGPQTPSGVKPTPPGAPSSSPKPTP